MIYSDEMHNAIKYGYHACAVEILRGYYFDKQEIIFKEYIQELYQLRLTYDKQHPMNFIAKILMNSLYGRFGMNDSFPDSIIVNNKVFSKYMNSLPDNKLKLISNITNIGDNNKIITVHKDPIKTMLDNASENHNVNIGIASAITALARIEMSKYKNDDNIKLYYTDTDSIFINLSPQELNNIYPSAPNICGSEIGKMKLEYKINRAVFLGPKAYYLELSNNKTIIKVKGLNSNMVNNSELTFDSFCNLLYKEKVLIMNQEKWFKKLNEGTIKVLNQSYSIKHNANKRELIYNNKDMLINTRPYIINNPTSR